MFEGLLLHHLKQQLANLLTLALQLNPLHFPLRKWHMVWVDPAQACPSRLAF